MSCRAVILKPDVGGGGGVNIHIFMFTYRKTVVQNTNI
jgi:hypothetical protein